MRNPVIERGYPGLTLARLFAHRLLPCVPTAVGAELVTVSPDERVNWTAGFLREPRQSLRSRDLTRTAISQREQ